MKVLSNFFIVVFLVTFFATIYFLFRAFRKKESFKRAGISAGIFVLSFILIGVLNSGNSKNTSTANKKSHAKAPTYVVLNKKDSNHVYNTDADGNFKLKIKATSNEKLKITSEKDGFSKITKELNKGDVLTTPLSFKENEPMATLEISAANTKKIRSSSIAIYNNSKAYKASYASSSSIAAAKESSKFASESSVKSAKASSKAASESAKEASKAAASSSKAASESAAAASSSAAKASSEAAAKNPDTYNSGITYDQIARTPKQYKGKNVEFTGQVAQVIEDSGVTEIRLAVNGDYDNIILVDMPNKVLNGSRILEDDLVTVGGQSMGTTSYKSTMGAKITIPSMLGFAITDKGTAPDDYGL